MIKNKRLICFITLVALFAGCVFAAEMTVI